MTYSEFVGVDFSVRKRDAGEGMWVARGTRTTDGSLVIESVETAADEFDCGTDRESTFEALVARVDGANAKTVFGFDVPFGIGAVDGSRETWATWVDGFPESVVEGGAESPKALYDAYKHAGYEPDADSTRETDDARGGLPPLNWRMKDLTYRGIDGVLRPIIERELASVVPLTERHPDGTAVVETYPAAVFVGTDGAARDGYKSVRRSAYETRRRNVDALRDAGVEFAETDTERRISCHDDALDAVAACVGAFRAARGEFAVDEPDIDPEIAALEGYIYG